MNITLIDNWQKIFKRWSFWLATASAALPEIMQFIAQNTDLIPWIDADTKGLLRLALTIAAIMAMPIRQTPKTPE